MRQRTRRLESTKQIGNCHNACKTAERLEGDTPTGFNNAVFHDFLSECANELGDGISFTVY